jgi:4-hydroxybenzoate polyprenyltransferase
MLGYAYSFNNFYDKKLKKKFFLLPLFFSLAFIFFLNFYQIFVYFLFISIVTFYSHPKFRWKSKPVISLFSNSIGFSLLFLLGSFSHTNINIEKLLIFFIFLCLNTAAQFIHEIVDYEDDKRNKIFTTTVAYGIRNSKRGILLTLVLTGIYSFIMYYLYKFLLFSFSTIIFSLYFSILILRKVDIDKRFRKKFKLLGILTGLVCLFSFIFEI